MVVIVRTGWWQNVVDEDEDGLLGAQLDSLSDHVDELPRREVARHQVLLLVDVRNVAPASLLDNDGDPVWVLLAYPQSLRLAFLCETSRAGEGAGSGRAGRRAKKAGERRKKSSG